MRAACTLWTRPTGGMAVARHAACRSVNESNVPYRTVLGNVPEDPDDLNDENVVWNGHHLFDVVVSSHHHVQTKRGEDQRDKGYE